MMKITRRVSRLLTNPTAEWHVIAAESDDVGAICRGYIAVLALIPAVSVLTGLAISGGRFLGVAGVTTAVTAAIVGWILALGSSIATAVIIEKLAPAFQSDGDTSQALKLVAYASTPLWLAGVCYLFVMLSPLVILFVVWAIYLLYLGLPIVMKTPQAHVVPFLLVSLLAFGVVNIVLRMVFATFRVPYY